MLPWVHLHTWPNGNVYPCCITPMEHIAGNLNDNSLEEIYGSKEWEHFFDSLINNPSCALKQCQYKCGNLEKDTYKK